MSTALIERVLPIPTLPPSIKEAVDRGQLVVFIGAGVSRILGCKGWAEVSNSLIDLCFQNDVVNYKEKRTLTQDANQKKKISICHHLLHQKSSTLFYEALRECLRTDKLKAEKYPIYEQLYKLRAVYVTTNADTCFDDLYFKDHIIYKPEDFNANLIDQRYLYHLHGTINDYNSLIFTVRTYLEHYTKANIQEFLVKLFSEYTILFVGYGLEEFEVLEHLFLKANAIKKDLRHFVLLPMFRGEENILAFEQSYYGDLGISVIPYAIDQKGYDQLYTVIESFQKEINLLSTFIRDSFVEIEKNSDHYEENRAKDILQLIKNDKPLENHFFKTLTSPQWLPLLKTGGYFEPSKNPKPEPANQDGYFTIPYWNALNYLTRVSEGVLISKDTEVERTLIEIFRSISRYRENNQAIHNFRTNWALIKIISNLSPLQLEKKDFDEIKQFCDNEFDVTLIGSEIVKTLLPQVLKANNKERILWLLDILTAPRFLPSSFGDIPKARIGDYWFVEFIKENKSALTERFPLDEAKVVMENVQTIITKNQHALFVPYSLTESEVRDYMEGHFQYAIIPFARDLLSAAIANSPEDTKLYFEELFSKNSPIYKRLSLAIFALNWKLCSEIFFKQASRDLFIDNNLKYELFVILETHFASFSDAAKDLIINWIEQGPNWTNKNEPEDVFNKAVAHWKQSWLLALTQSGYDKAIDAYQKYEKLTNMKPERPELITGIFTEFTNESESPLGSQEILEMSSLQLADFPERV